MKAITVRLNGYIAMSDYIYRSNQSLKIDQVVLVNFGGEIQTAKVIAINDRFPIGLPSNQCKPILGVFTGRKHIQYKPFK